jgi:hypothetical protein
MAGMQKDCWSNPCQVLVAAPFALGADETVLEPSAAKVRVKLLAHETW